jgi:hypothetical protein
VSSFSFFLLIRKRTGRGLEERRGGKEGEVSLVYVYYSSFTMFSTITQYCI